jgi:tetratricopeptide (TPR) repeat protein
MKQARYSVWGLLVCAFWACTERKENIPIRETTDLQAIYSLSSLQILQKSLELNPEDTETLYKLALWHNYHKEYKKAETYLQEALKIREDWRFYLLEAQVQYALNLPRQSYDTWRKAYRLAPQHLPVLLFGLQWAVEQKDLLKTENLLKETEKFFPKDPQFFLWKAKWAVEQSDTTHALQLFEQCLAQDATFAEAYKHISFLNNKTRKPEKALFWANKGLAVKPFYDSLLLEKAIAYEQLKKTDSANKYFLKAYQLNRNLYQASYFLGIERWKSGNYTEALNFFENTYRLKPNLPKLAYYLANCYEKTQRYPQALEFYEKAIRQEPENSLAAQDLYFLKQKLELERQKKIADSLQKLQFETFKKATETNP